MEVVDGYLAQIARHNPELNAGVTLNEDGARGRELAFGGRRIHANSGAWHHVRDGKDRPLAAIIAGTHVPRRARALPAGLIP